MDGPGPRKLRGDRSRTAILEAARDRFAREGFTQTTIRSVANDASIDPSMVIRYFGNKDGLYLAATQVDLHFAQLADTPRACLGEALASHFFQQWEHGETSRLLRTLLRTSLEPGPGADQIKRVLAQQLQPLLTRQDIPPTEAETRAGMIAAVVLGFALSRYLLQIPALTTLQEETAMAYLSPTIQQLIDLETRPARSAR